MHNNKDPVQTKINTFFKICFFKKLKTSVTLATLLRDRDYGDATLQRLTRITQLMRVRETLEPRSDSGGHVLLAGPTQPHTERISLYPATFPGIELT